MKQRPVRRFGELPSGVRVALLAVLADAKGATAVSREDVFDALAADLFTQGGLKQRQLTAAELGAEARRLPDRAVILHQLHYAIEAEPRFGHVTFLLANAGQAGHPLLEWSLRGGHPCAVSVSLLTG